MKIIAAVDDNFGLLFNKRRQSQDSVLRRKVGEIIKSSNFLMNSYSFKQFKNEIYSDNIKVSNDFMEMADKDDYVFIENTDISDYQDKIKEIILFKWNRKYPGDFFLNINLKKFSLSEVEEFKGSSHDKITMEVYK